MTTGSRSTSGRSTGTICGSKRGHHSFFFFKLILDMEIRGITGRYINISVFSDMYQ